MKIFVGHTDEKTIPDKPELPWNGSTFYYLTSSNNCLYLSQSAPLYPRTSRRYRNWFIIIIIVNKLQNYTHINIV